jgi:3-oxoacyl-[acyl-carrier-protein] synthase-1
MSGPDLPPPSEILPHAGPMVLLSRVLHHEADRTVCEVDIDTQSMFLDPAGNVAAWIGIEYMAQCIAAHAGLVGRADGKPPQLGFLVGSRRIDFHTPGFRRGQTLEVTARRVWGGVEGAASFDCALLDASTRAVLAAGRLSCFTPPAGAGSGGGT